MHKRDCFQDMTVEATLNGDIHFEALGKHKMYMFKRIRQKSQVGMGGWAGLGKTVDSGV